MDKGECGCLFLPQSHESERATLPDRLWLWSSGLLISWPAGSRRYQVEFVDFRDFVGMLRRVKQKFLIDTDTASDDAVALIMALRHPDVEVLAITTVAGNVAVKQASSNALYTVELCASNVPVYVGAEKPLKREHRAADWFHGRDGLGERGYVPAGRRAEKKCATEAIVETVEANPGLVLVTLGPLTNVAMAVQQRPEIAKKVSRCVVMGGAACCEGNVTPAAEYNIWCDPEAAKIVMRSGLPIELVSWHLCRGEAVLNRSDIEHVLSFNNAIARFAIECNRLAARGYFVQTGEHGICLPDPVAMTVAVEPEIVTAQSEHFVEVETNSELTQGMTVVDRLNVAGDERNCEVWREALAGGHKAKVVWSIDNARWKQALYKAVARG
jgi:purine nucleosidase